MANDLLSYILLGFSLSVPVGAITIEMIKRGLQSGFWHAWFVGVGGMSADAVLMLLIYFGIANFLTGPAAQITIWLFGCAVLVYLGIGSIKEAFRGGSDFDSGRKRQSDTLPKAYLSGFAIALSNPLNIIFWISIYGSVLASAMQTMNGGKVLLYSSVIFIGIAIWDLVIAGTVHFGRGFVGKRFMKWFLAAAGLVLIGFGLSFAGRHWLNWFLSFKRVRCQAPVHLYRTIVLWRMTGAWHRIKLKILSRERDVQGRGFFCSAVQPAILTVSATVFGKL